MRITQWAEYGSHCAIYLARELKNGNVTVTAHDVARELNIESDYAQQILQRLRKGGIIESVRGPTGGYKLVGDPRLITLKDLMLATEGTTFDVMCDSKPLEEACSSTEYACSLKGAWIELKKQVERYLETVTLESLAARIDPQPLVTITKLSNAEERLQ